MRIQVRNQGKQVQKEGMLDIKPNWVCTFMIMMVLQHLLMM